MLDLSKINQCTNLWEKGSMCRGYVRLLDVLANKVERYSTGNFHNVEIDGIWISNAEARRLSYAKCYYDYNKKEFVFDDTAEQYKEKILAYFTTDKKEIKSSKEDKKKTRFKKGQTVRYIGDKNKICAFNTAKVAYVAKDGYVWVSVLDYADNGFYMGRNLEIIDS